MSAIILIPGAGGNASYWQWVEPLLRARGHDVVAVDLPSGDERAGVPEYAEATVAAIGARTRPVLVAQSLGAFTAAAVAERIPVQAVVFVHGMIPAPGETAGAWWDVTGQSQAMREAAIADGRDPEWDDDALFFHDIPADRIAVVRSEGDPPQTMKPFESAVGDGWRGVPVRAVAGAGDRLFPLAFMQRIARERLGIDPDVLDSGHLSAISHPDELAELLDRYARETAPEGGAGAG